MPYPANNAVGNRGIAVLQDRLCGFVYKNLGVKVRMTHRAPYLPGPNQGDATKLGSEVLLYRPAAVDWQRNAANLGRDI